MITDKEAAIAWRTLKQFVNPPKEVQGWVQDLDDYFKQKA